MTKLTTMCCVLAAGTLAGGCAAEDGRVKALIITGENNHNWRYTSRFHKDTLEATGRFAVDITDTPAASLADPKLLANYKVVVLDYNDFNTPKRWGQPAESVFIEAVRNGLGVVAVHSANNAFVGWKEYGRWSRSCGARGRGTGSSTPST
jgi:hypothetical protein